MNNKLIMYLPKLLLKIMYSLDDVNEEGFKVERIVMFPAPNPWKDHHLVTLKQFHPHG